MIRHLYSIFVVLFFVGMMSLLARDHILPWIERGDSIPISMAQVVDSWTAIDDTFSVRINGQLLGYIRTVANQREDAQGFEAFNIIVPAREGSGLRLETATLANPMLEVQQARMQVAFGSGAEPISAGALVDGETLRLRIESSSGLQLHQLPLSEPITMNLAVEPFVASNDLAPGERYGMTVYDPLWGTESGRMTIEMVGTETLVMEERGQVPTMIVEARFQGQTMRIYFDENNVPVRREIRFGGEGSGPAAASLPEITLRMERLPERSPTRQREDLRRIPELPDFAAADFAGENTGDPMTAVTGLFPILLREGGLGLLNRNSGTPQND